MRQLVIVAHPVVGSFTMALAHAYTSELAQLGHRVVFCDLYRRAFNPVLAADELIPGAGEHVASADAAKAQQEVIHADAVTLIYPLWWMSMPAIMKGYIDRVFSRGFAYESHDGVVQGLLSGKKAVLITLSGAPLPLLTMSGKWNAVQVLQDTHILRSTGFEVLEHLHFDEIVPNLSGAVAASCTASVRNCAQRHFRSGSSATSEPSKPSIVSHGNSA